ncbi:CHAT domain-containing protein [Erythrobacter sp. SCSIO 43205]|uniref:CHAT domain-containing protein n=1 Tax=Erythrobacter sp. SCSIO 43205 TaxID=2779361 RepID=UPI001CA8D5FC|nr:CHAT domain-containing tetratricopeptide repeat protein [Erythrobacter sp. SCSIO 43205]UAB78924.1 CHAT domain-containing protein [Erythrobacter sp. SCSIO 43205]
MILRKCVIVCAAIGLSASLEIQASAQTETSGQSTVDRTQNEDTSNPSRVAIQRLMKLNARAIELLEIGATSDGLEVFGYALSGAQNAFGADSAIVHVIAANYYQSLEEEARELLERVEYGAFLNESEIRPLIDQMERLEQDYPGRRHVDAIDFLYKRAANIAESGGLREARRLFREAHRLNVEVRGEKHPETLAARAEYAFTLSRLGRAEEAMEITQEVLRQRQAMLGDRHPDTLRSLSHYAHSLRGLRRFAAAAEVDQQVLDARREILGSDAEETLESLTHLAADLRALGRYEGALALIEEALSVQAGKLGNYHSDTLRSLSDKGSILADLKRYEESAIIFDALYPYLQEAKGEENELTRQVQGDYGSVLFRLGRLEEAKDLLYKAREATLSALGGKHPETLARHLEYTELLLEMDNSTLDQALATQRAAIGTVQAYRSRLALQFGSALSQAGQKEAEKGTLQDAEKAYADSFWATKITERPGTLGLSSNEMSAAGMRLTFAALQAANTGSASKALARAAASRFAATAGLQELVEERQALIEEWAQLTGAMASSISGTGASLSGRKALDDRIEAVERRVSRLDERLKNEAPQYFSIIDEDRKSLSEMREILGPDEAILLLTPTRRGTHSMVVARDRFGWWRSDRSETEINDTVAEFRLGLEVQAGSDFLPAFDVELAHALYADLVEPVKQALQGKTRVYVVAGGALSRLPLGTLLTEPVAPDLDPFDPETLRNASWLADSYALVQLPSVQSLFYIRSFGITGDDRAGAGFTGFGDPELRGSARVRGARSATIEAIDAARLVSELRGETGVPLMNPEALKSLASLPGTKTELERVREALGEPENTLFLGDRMTETAIRKLDLSTTRILHFATHGFTSEESGETAEPGLVFTPPDEATAFDDGYLAASEVIELDLSSARWIVMSACNTASPSGKPGETGLSGLAQSFFYAGAQSLLVSHWPVFDDIAPLLTVETLKRSQAGQGRAEALQAAMRQIREDPKLDAAHPAVWAPFTLVGEGR